MNLLLIYWLLLIIWFTNCTSIQNTYYEVNENIDFLHYNTFAWFSKDSVSIQNTLYDNPFTQKKLKRAIYWELEKRGLILSENAPDIHHSDKR